MEEKTLEELKAENAATEEEETKDTASEETETEEEAAEEEAQESESEAETDEEEGDEPEVEDWQQSDEQASEGSGDKRFTDSDVAAAKRKLRAKLEKAHNSEIDELKRQIEALKGGRREETPSVKPMPTLEQHGYDEAKFQKALQDWMTDNAQHVTKSTLEQERQAQRQSQQRQALETAVDSHYQRAAKLAQEADISAEVYQASDLAVRQAIEDVLPGAGDSVTDELIARLGEGSEKVMFSLGRNTSKREILKAKLAEDPSGLTASIYLGELKGRLATPSKKTSKAPPPAKRPEGGKTGTGTEDKLRRQYQKETDIQKRLDMRRKARKAGIDVTDW